MAIMRAEATTDRGVFRVERELIEVRSDQPRPDEQWRYTDHAGHDHYWQAGREPYPTLREVVDETYWCEDCEDEHTSSHLECPLCGETIVPGSRPPSLFPERIPGPVSYFLDDQPISEEQAREMTTAQDDG